MLRHKKDIIVAQKVGRDFTTTTSDLEIQIPGLTSDLEKLELKELKVVVNAAAVAGLDPSYITLEIISPTGGLSPPSGNKLDTVPQVQVTGTQTAMYRQYQHPLVLLELNAIQATMKTKSIKLRILDSSGVALPKDFVYLRLDLQEAENYGPYLQPLPVARFQAL